MLFFQIPPRLYPQVFSKFHKLHFLYPYLYLLLFKHVWPWCVEYVISQLSLTINVDGCGGFTRQEAVVYLSSPLGQLEAKSYDNVRIKQQITNLYFNLSTLRVYLVS